MNRKYLFWIQGRRRKQTIMVGFTLVFLVVVVQIGTLTGGPGLVSGHPAMWKTLWQQKNHQQQYPQISSFDPNAKNWQWYSELTNSSENKLLFREIQNSEGAFYDIEHNVVGSIHFNSFHQYQSQPYVSNGYIGSRIPNVGHGFAYDTISDRSGANSEDTVNGWPLFNRRYSGAFVAGFFDIQKRLNGTNFPELLDNGYESTLAAVPQWTTLTVAISVDGKRYVLTPETPPSELGSISNYTQKTSLDSAIVTTEYVWMHTIRLKYSILAHRQNTNLGVVSLVVENLKNHTLGIEVVDLLDFKTAQRCQFSTVGTDNNDGLDSGIFMVFQPHEIDYVDGVIYSKLSLQNVTVSDNNTDSISQSATVNLDPNSDIEIFKTVGIVTSDYDATLNSVEKLIAFARNVSDVKQPMQDVYQSHIVEWNQLIGDVPLISFPKDRLLTMAARASIYHLLANTRPDASGVSAALGVGGLSSDSYAGMVFWDADLWMYHALLPFSPQHAKSIVNYRLHTRKQAQKNVPHGYKGAVYPWTSGRFGNCTSTGPCLDYEYHINHAVVQAGWNLYLSGAVDDGFLQETVLPMMEEASSFLTQYLTKYNSSSDTYWTFNMTDPDEYANHINNGAYTNGGISRITSWTNAIRSHFETKRTPEYDQISANMEMPHSSNSDNITLEYTGMNASVEVKQADVIMLTYPLENVLIDHKQALTNMQFYSQKQVSYGPAMTFPIFSIVASKLATTGCSSQLYLHKSVQPYLRAPFAQFSEQSSDDFLTNGGTHPAFPFLTGHGGFVQAVVQGLTGLRYSYDVDATTGKINRYLEIDPVSVSLFGDELTINKLVYMNTSLTFDVKHNMLVITNNGPLDSVAPKAVQIKVADRNSKNGTYDLKHHQQLKVPLFVPQRNTNDSLCECELAQFTAISESAFGDSPLLINDGDNFTHWQAKYNDSTAKLLVDLKHQNTLKGGVINWGDRPPLQYRVYALSAAAAGDFEDASSIHTAVDFANRNRKRFNQYEVFDEIAGDSVSISAAYDPKSDDDVAIVKRFNITEFELKTNVSSRYVLLTFDGVHGKDADSGGAKVFEIVLT